jgi:hypothetical protein
MRAILVVATALLACSSREPSAPQPPPREVVRDASVVAPDASVLSSHALENILGGGGLDDAIGIGSPCRPERGEVLADCPPPDAASAAPPLVEAARQALRRAASRNSHISSEWADQVFVKNVQAWTLAPAQLAVRYTTHHSSFHDTRGCIGKLCNSGGSSVSSFCIALRLDGDSLRVPACIPGVGAGPTTPIRIRAQ